MEERTIQFPDEILQGCIHINKLLDPDHTVQPDRWIAFNS
jgi:hypothetical protein